MIKWTCSWIRRLSYTVSKAPCPSCCGCWSIPRSLYWKGIICLPESINLFPFHRKSAQCWPSRWAFGLQKKDRHDTNSQAKMTAVIEDERWLTFLIVNLYFVNNITVLRRFAYRLVLISLGMNPFLEPGWYWVSSLYTVALYPIFWCCLHSNSKMGIPYTLLLKCQSLPFSATRLLGWSMSP
jgi:hypothetical protein